MKIASMPWIVLFVVSLLHLVGCKKSPSQTTSNDPPTPPSLNSPDTTQTGASDAASNKTARVPAKFLSLARPIYDVTLRNGTDQVVRDLGVKFDDGSWEFTFGIGSPGVGKTYAGIVGMPPIPASATIKWQDEAGEQHSVVTKIADDIRKQGKIRSELEFVIKEATVVEVHFREW